MHSPKLHCALLLALIGCANVAEPVSEPTTAAEQVAPRTDPSIQLLSASGTGCPAGSVIEDRVPEGSALNLLFDHFALNTPHEGVTTLACTLKFKVKANRGLSGSAFNFSNQVDTILESGAATGTFEATYAFSGAQGTKKFSHDLDKSVPTNVFNHEVSGRDFTWSRCQNEGVLTVQLRTRVNDPNDEGIVDLIALDVHSLDYRSRTQCTAR